MKIAWWHHRQKGNYCLIQVDANHSLSGRNTKMREFVIRERYISCNVSSRYWLYVIYGRSWIIPTVHNVQPSLLLFKHVLLLNFIIKIWVQTLQLPQLKTTNMNFSHLIWYKFSMKGAGQTLKFWWKDKVFFYDQFLYLDVWCVSLCIRCPHLNSA